MTLSRNIAQLLVHKGLEINDVEYELRKYKLLSLLPAIKDAVIKLSSSLDADGTIHIESPFDLSAEAVARIQRIVGNDLVKTEVTINKDILSGFKARFKGKLYDGSGERIIRYLITK